MDATRSMLAIANLPRTYLEEVISTACYIFNRAYSRSIRTTPFSLWFRENPNDENLRIFGCPSYALVPLDTRSKLDNHMVRTILSGYGEPHGYKGYQYLHLLLNQSLVMVLVLFHISPLYVLTRQLN